MNRIPLKHKYSIGELVSAAYKQAARVTRNRRVAALIASQTLERWLTKSDRPDLVQQLQAATA